MKVAVCLFRVSASLTGIPEKIQPALADCSDCCVAEIENGAAAGFPIERKRRTPETYVAARSCETKGKADLRRNCRSIELRLEYLPIQHSCDNSAADQQQKQPRATATAFQFPTIRVAFGNFLSPWASAC